MQTPEDLSLRQLRNQNALEVAKIFSDEMNHYRSRLNLSVTSFSALCLLIAGAVQTYSSKMSSAAAALLIGLLMLLVLWISEILLVTRARSRRAREIRQALLKAVDLPSSFTVKGPEGIDFGVPATNSILGITTLSLLIVAFVALLPIFVIVAKMGWIS